MVFSRNRVKHQSFGLLAQRVVRASGVNHCVIGSIPVEATFNGFLFFSAVSLFTVSSKLYLGSWRNRLSQEAYTFKVAGSSPALPTLATDE